MHSNNNQPAHALRMRQPKFILASIFFISSCSGTYQNLQPPPKNTIEGFGVFHGRCLNSDTTKMSGELIPLLTNVVAGGIKMTGTSLKKYGEDKDAKFATTLNFDGDESLNDCIHIVHGKVYTDKVDFIASPQPLDELLPLPWDAIAKASLEDNASSKQISDQTQATMTVAKTTLASSGAMIAEKPRLFAELRILRSKDRSSISLRLRAFFYGSPLTERLFSRKRSKAIIISFAPFDPAKPLIDSIKTGYSIPFYSVPVGSAWVSGDLLYPTISASQAWETPYYPTSSLGKRPITLVLGVLETTAGSQILTVLGTALEGTADATAKGIIDNLDTNKVSAEEIKDKLERDKARTESATATVKAIADLGKANDAYDSCVAILASSNGPINKAQRDAILEFTSARVIAAASIAAAEPTILALNLDTKVINEPLMCIMP